MAPVSGLQKLKAIQFDLSSDSKSDYSDLFDPKRGDSFSN